MQEKGFKTLRFNTLKAYEMRPEIFQKACGCFFIRLTVVSYTAPTMGINVYLVELRLSMARDVVIGT